jgi:RNA polymerase sigma factor (sigma-70 family)
VACFADLVSAGYLGLVAAIDRIPYPGSGDFVFSPYACACIRREMVNWLQARARQRGPEDLVLELDGLANPDAVRPAQPQPALEEAVEDRLEWEAARGTLGFSELVVICARFYGDRTVANTAGHLNRSERWVLRRQRDAINGLRQALDVMR